METTKGHRDALRTPQDFVDSWISTLDILKANDLLDGIIYVDIGGEFPLQNWYPHIFEYITGENPQSGPEMFEVIEDDWEDDAIERMNEFLVGGTKKIKEAYPEFRYTWSSQIMGEDNYLRCDFSEFGVFEPHIWCSDDLSASVEIGYFDALGDIEFPANIAKMWYKAEAKHKAEPEFFNNILDERTDKWAAVSKKTGLPLVTTEAWATVIYEDFSHNGCLGEWDWFKDVCEFGVRHAIAKGWVGICTSNFSEPHFEGLWRDVEWHKRLTDMIKTGKLD
ncbi:hypothetical protein L4D76_19690 [Photobacterium sagamiensis]